MRELEELTYSEVKTIYDLIEVQLKVMEATCKAVEVRDEILSVEKKLVKYLNENKHDSDRA